MKINSQSKLIASDASLGNISGFQIDLTEKRTKHFTGLKPGATYYFYTVNNAGVSPLIEVVSMKCW